MASFTRLGCEGAGLARADVRDLASAVPTECR